jgi:hypothetical protein
MEWKDLTLKDVEAINEFAKFENSLKAKMEIFKLLTKKDPTDMLLVDFFTEYNKTTEFMLTEPTPVKVGEIEVNGERFKPMLEFKDWTTSKGISYHNVITNQPDNIALQVAILLEGDYTAGELERREQLIREHCRYDVVYSLSLFFWSVYSSFLKATTDYLTPTPMMSQANSANIGGGTASSITLQEEREIYSPSEN